MTNKDINKIYFRGNEIVALYRGDTLIFKKKPTGVYIIKGSVIPDSTAQNIQFTVNNVEEQIAINSDKTFEHTFTNVPVTNMDFLTQFCKEELKTLDLTNFNTSNVTSMVSMFSDCYKLTSLDVSNIDTSNVTNMANMFLNCSKLTSLDVSNIDTSNVTRMDSMFSDCRNLTSLDLTNFNTSNVTRMERMFDGCYKLTSLDLSNFNTSKVTDMNRMFYNCENLTSLDLSNFNTSNVTNMDGMFNYCPALTSLDVSNFDTSKVRNMGYMFGSCRAITSLDLSNFNTSNVTDMGNMFTYNWALTDLYINFDVSSITDYIYDYNNIFYQCNSLKNVVGKFEGTKFDLDLSSCPLTAASAMVFINGLATVTTTRTLSLSATTYDSLTPEQIAIATAKGWTVARG